MANNQPKVSPDLTFSVAKVLTYTATSQMLCEVLSNESYIKHKSRDTLNRMANRCKMVQSDIYELLGEESVRIMKEEVSNPEAHLQIDQMVNIMLAMPVGIRNEIEEYAVARYNIYASNLKS